MDNKMFFDINNMGEGVIQDLLNKELNRVLENIQDVNTVPEKKRTITAKISFSPNKTRTAAMVTVECSSNLVPDSTFETQIAIGLDGGLIKAREISAKQLSLFTEEKVNLRRAK